MTTIIKLKSADDKIYSVDLEVAQMSETIRTMLEHLRIDDSGEEVIPIPTVRGEILQKVISWGEHHVKDEESDYPPPVIQGPYRWPLPTDDINEWDQDFMDVDVSEAFEIILAANFLDIKGLLDLGCKSVANRIMGKSTEEIRDILRLKPSRRIRRRSSSHGEGRKEDGKVEDAEKKDDDEQAEVHDDECDKGKDIDECDKDKDDDDEDKISVITISD